MFALLVASNLFLLTKTCRNADNVPERDTIIMDTTGVEEAVFEAPDPVDSAKLVRSAFEAPVPTDTKQRDAQNQQSESEVKSSSREAVPMQVWHNCVNCFGSGNCNYCYGQGVQFNPYNGNQEDCPVCREGRCPMCGGRGGQYEVEYR